MKLLRFTVKKTKKDYYNSSNEKDVCDKNFLENSEIFSLGQDSFKGANLASWKWWNNFWRLQNCRITELFLFRHCKIPEYKPRNDSLFENVSNPILNLVLRYRNHPNILTIGAVCTNKLNKQPLFSFSQATRDNILK